MRITEIQHLQPSMAVIAEEFDTLGWQYRVDTGSGGRQFHGVRLFRPQSGLNEDYVYIVRPEDTSSFPTNRYAYLCTVPLSGSAAR